MHSDREEEAAFVVRCLRQLVHGLRVSSHSVESEVGLTGAQLFVLRELALEPNVSIRRLSERTMTDPSSASVVLGRLVEAGLVTREKDPTDRRRTVLSVSKRGQSVLRSAPEPFQAKLFAALSALPRRELGHLREGLSALLFGVGQSRGRAPLFLEETKAVPAKRSRHAKRSR